MKKNCCSEMPSSLILGNTPFLDWIVTCDEKWIYMTTSDDQLSAKTNLHQKEVTVTVWWSAARLIHYNFLNRSETITSERYVQQTDEKH